MYYPSIQHCDSMQKRQKAPPVLSALPTPCSMEQLPDDCLSRKILCDSLLRTQQGTLPSAEEMAATNRLANMVAMVCLLWHSALAPIDGRDPSFNRWVTLGEVDMLRVALYVRPWWRWVIGGEDVGLLGGNEIKNTYTELFLELY